MAAPTILQVMQGIETRLDTITGLNVSAFVTDQISPPVAIVGVPPIQYRETMQKGKFSLAPTVTVLVSAALDRTGQTLLAGFANPTGSASIITAIEGDKTLGGVVDDCIVWDFRPLGLDEVGQVGYYGGIFNLRVLATGT